MSDPQSTHLYVNIQHIEVDACINYIAYIAVILIPY